MTIPVGTTLDPGNHEINIILIRQFGTSIYGRVWVDELFQPGLPAMPGRLSIVDISLRFIG